jgi:Zn-dependent protease
VLISVLVLVVFCIAVPGGRELVIASLNGGIGTNAPSGLQAVVVLAILAIEINLSLFYFNLLPIPPLDGSRMLRNVLPYNAMQAYDRIPMWVSYLFMIFLGGYIIHLLLDPSMTLIFAPFAHLNP